MSEFKNPRLMLGGAAIGALTQDPEEHPLTGLAGMGIGAYIGGTLEIVKTEGKKVFERVPKQKTVTMKDDIAVDLNNLNESRKLDRSRFNISDILKSRMRDTARKDRYIRKVTYSDFKNSFYESIKQYSDGKRLFKLKKSVDFDKAVKILEEGQYEHLNTFKKMFTDKHKLLNDNDIKTKMSEIQDLRKVAEERRVAAVNSYEAAIRENFKIAYGADIDTLLNPETAKFLILGSMYNGRQNVKDLERNLLKFKPDAKFRSSFSAATRRANITFDESTAIHSPALKKMDLSQIPEYKGEQMPSLVIDRNVSKDEKVKLISNYLKDNLGNEEGEADRIAKNIAEHTNQARIDIHGGQIEITQPGQSAAKFNLTQRLNGREVERFNGNTYTPIKYNIFAGAARGSTIPGGRSIFVHEKGLTEGSTAVEAKSVDINVKNSSFSQVETALMHSAITGEPLIAMEDHYRKSSYVSSNETFDRLGIVPRDPAIDITNQAKTYRGSTNFVKVSSSLSFDEFSAIEREINESRIALDLPTMAPGKIRSQSNHLDTIDHSGNITSSMVPNPHRSAGVMNRGNKLIMSDTVATRTRDGYINAIWRKATEQLFEEGKGGNLVGSMLATVSTLPNSFNSATANSIFGLSIGDGQTITTMSGYSSAAPKVIDLGKMTDFTGNEVQIKRMQDLAHGKPVVLKPGEEIGIVDGVRVTVPKEYDEIHGIKLELKDGSYKLHGIGYTHINRPNNSVGTKIFGEIKSNAITANIEDISNQSLISMLEDYGILKSDRGRLRISGTVEEMMESATSNLYDNDQDNILHKSILKHSLEEAVRSIREPMYGKPRRPNLTLNTMNVEDWREAMADFNLRLQRFATAANDENSVRVTKDILRDIGNRTAIEKSNVYVRAEDAKALSTVESVNMALDKGPFSRNFSVYDLEYSQEEINNANSRLSNSINEILLKSKDPDTKVPVYDPAKNAIVGADTNYAARDLLEIKNQVDEGAVGIERLSHLSNKARAVVLAEKAINDDKASNLTYATYMRSLIEYNEALKVGKWGQDHNGNRIKVSPDSVVLTLRGGNKDGSDMLLRFGTDIDGNQIDSHSIVKMAAEGISNRTQRYAKGNTKNGMTPHDMYTSIRDDVSELFDNLSTMGIEAKNATLTAIQSGNEYITGANNNKATISWMAQKAFYMNDMGPDVVTGLSYANNDALYELRSRSLQRNSGQSLEDAFGKDMTRAKTMISNLLSPETVDRYAMVKGSIPNLKEMDGVASIDLVVPDGVNPKRFGDIKSVSIPLINTDLSGIVTLDDGTTASMALDKKKRSLLLRMADYNEAIQSGGSKEYIEAAKAAYLKAYDEWRDLDKATEKNVAKNATRRQFTEGASVTAVATSGDQEKLRLMQFNNHKRNSVFINKETAASLGFLDPSMYTMEDTGFEGIKRIVYKGTKDSVMGVSVREPASGPLSAMVTDIYFDSKMKPEGLALSMGANYLSAQSGDLDGDKLTLGVLLKNADKYNTIRESMNKAMGLQTSMMTDYGDFISNINLKMKNMRDFYDESKPIEGVSNIEGDKAADSMRKILSGSQRDFQAPEITAIQQLISGSIAKDHNEEIARIMGNTALTAEQKADQIMNRTMLSGLAFEASRVIQENILKSVRKTNAKGAKSAESLLDALSNIRKGISVDSNKAHEQMGIAIKDWIMDVYGEDFKKLTGGNAKKMNETLDQVANLIMSSVKKHGAEINIDPSNFVGDVYMKSDKIAASYNMIEKTTDRALRELAEGSEVLQEALESAKISPIEDGFSSIIETIKANKKPLLFGGIGLGALAFVAGAEAPNTSSPMYNSPVARTNPTLPPLEDSKSYIADDWGISPNSVTVNGRTIDGSTDEMIKQRVRGMFQGDSNARNTLRIQEQKY